MNAQDTLDALNEALIDLDSAIDALRPVDLWLTTPNTLFALSALDRLMAIRSAVNERRLSLESERAGEHEMTTP